MATFGPISDPTPNVLFDPAKALGSAQLLQRNQLMMENAKQDQAAQMHERDANARIALARQFADAPDDALATEWGPAVQRMQSAGLGIGIPTTPPSRERLKQIASSDLTTFQRMKLEVEREQAQAMGEYRQGMLGLAQQREARVAAPRPRSGGGGGGGIELVPLASPAPAAPMAGGGNTAGPAPAPAGPQMSEATPEVSPTAARLGGVDVAGPGAPPAPAPAGPPAGVRMMVRNGMPITTGLPTGQAWGQDASGARVVVDIPGAKKMGGDAPAPPIGGQGLDSALMNILVAGDPASPQYAAAFARLGAEEVLPSGLTRRPDMSPFRQPTYRPPGVVEPGAAPALPQGGRTYGKAETGQAPGAATALPASEAERKAGSYLERMQGAEQLLDGMVKGGYDPGNVRDRVAQATPFVGNFLSTEKGQQYMNAAAEWARAKLRLESGAVIGEEEAKAEARTYFPMPGDSPDTIKQKKLLRDTASSAVRRQAGRAAPGEAPGGGDGAKADPLEGRTITNGNTGEKMIRRNGKWEPM